MLENADKHYYDFEGIIRLKSYYYALRTAKESLNRAEDDVEGSFYLCLSCLTFCYFSIEAYLNHIGESEMNAWSEDERIDFKEKLKRLEGKGVRFDQGGSLYQRIKSLEELRNNVAHGRTKTVTYVAKNVENISEQHAIADESFWGMKIETATCRAMLQDVEEFLSILGNQISGSPFHSLGSGRGVRRLKP